jgi:ApbE superfamily uncharacterized protein (UPF0280 family)
VTARASHRLLPDGRRLHLQHGPIDIIAEAEGAAGEVVTAYRQAVARFETILEELVAELPVLRSAIVAGECPLSGAVARTMWSATNPYATALATPHFVTPMAAVAGAVADAVLASMIEGRELDRAYVNNGGDIALHLPANAKPFNLAIVVNPEQPASPGAVSISPLRGVGGVATSGWKGRSFSLGIADSVTAFASTAAQADVAATIIANAIDLPCNPAIVRQPAAMLAPDSDLGERLVTVAVGTLSEAEIDLALAAGEERTFELVQAGLIKGALLVLKNIVRVVGDTPPEIVAVSSPRTAPALKGPLHASKGADWDRGKSWRE